MRFIRHLLLGILLGAVLAPSTTHAQWTVFDPAQYSLQIERQIEEANRWLERVRQLIEEIGPDLVHAMRIPFEGILAAKATPRAVPLLVSVWGNDFTLWAGRNPLIARQTRQTLRRADALHTDCRRDLALAVEAWGFDAKKLAAVLPGAGGVQTTRFDAGPPDAGLRRQLDIADDTPVNAKIRLARSSVNFMRQFLPGVEELDGDAALDVDVRGTIGHPILSGSGDTTGHHMIVAAPKRAMCVAMWTT